MPRPWRAAARELGPVLPGTFVLALAAACLAPAVPQAREARLNGEVWVNNLGDPDIGQGQAGVGLRAAPTDWLDAGLSYEHATDATAWSAFGDVAARVGGRLRLAGYAGSSEYEFDGDGGTIAVQSASRGVNLIVPMRQARRFADEVSLQIARSDNEVTDGSVRLLDEEVGSARLSYASAWDRGARVGRWRLTFASGLPGLTDIEVDRRSRFGAEPLSESASSLSTRYAEAFRLTRNYELFVGVDGQYAFDPLPYGRKHAYGGVGRGGAFRPNSLVGDHGVNAAVEIRRFFSAGPLQAARLYLRADGGWVRSRRDAFARPEDRASTVSFGMAGRLSKQLSSRLEINTPLEEPRFASGAGSRVLFELMASF